MGMSRKWHQTTIKIKNFCNGGSFDRKRNFLPAYNQIRESNFFLVHPNEQHVS